MRHGGEFLFKYKDVHCLIDNDDISEILSILNESSPQSRVAFLYNLEGKNEIKRGIDAYLKKQYLDNKDAFINRYNSKDYYEDDAKYIISFYLKGYAQEINRACYGEFYNKIRDEDNIYNGLYNLSDKDCCIISMFNVYKLLFFKSVKFSGHIYFSRNEISRLTGTLRNFYLELKNGTIINFNPNYVDLCIPSGTSHFGKEEL
ncbi:MAG TPA: hypothetical protein VF941_03675 [Clostridia bacterium]